MSKLLLLLDLWVPDVLGPGVADADPAAADCLALAPDDPEGVLLDPGFMV